MKKLFTLFGITVIGIIAANAQVPNPSFENWTGNSPNGWYTTFSGSSISTQAHSGTKALKMNPWSASNYGSNTYCPQSGDKFSLNGLQPTSLDGWYISNFVNGDMTRIIVSIYSNGNICGTGNLTLNINSSAYTQFSIPIYLFGSPADSAYIQITQNNSSYGVSGLNPATYIIFDDIDFTGTVGLSSTGSQKMETIVYPNPAGNLLHVQMSEYEDSQIEIYNALDQKVYAGNTTGVSTQLDISAFSPGIYLLRVTRGNEPIYQTKIVKQ